MRNLIACVLGVVFALGLGVSGMTNPEVVKGFLDVTGDWNPALMFVMGSAIPIYALVWYARRRRAPLLGGNPPVARADIDRRLLAGSALFGVGWGLSGICPGPAVTILGRPSAGALVFLGCVVAGMLLFRFVAAPGAKLRAELGK